MNKRLQLRDLGRKGDGHLALCIWMLTCDQYELNMNVESVLHQISAKFWSFYQGEGWITQLMPHPRLVIRNHEDNTLILAP